MKRKIDKIKGKRLVMGGGTNLLTKDEILVTETPNGVELKERSNDGSIKEIASGGGGGDSDEYEYYKCPVRGLTTWAIRIENEVVLSFIELINMICTDFTWAACDYVGTPTRFHYHVSALIDSGGWNVFMKVPKYINKGTVDSYSHKGFLIKNKNLIEALSLANALFAEEFGNVEYESNIETIISRIEVSSYEEMYDNYKEHIDAINNLYD